ncbi:hypothetical protein ACH5RR_006008 [Cinchona calisaya]|uniref:Uncharacterized protein n=1 Tax=Cinchona calisaya TaxID=153742 RepID=A0ABD3AMR8_9GENT
MLDANHNSADAIFDQANWDSSEGINSGVIYMHMLPKFVLPSYPNSPPPMRNEGKCAKDNARGVVKLKAKDEAGKSLKLSIMEAIRLHDEVDNIETTLSVALLDGKGGASTNKSLRSLLVSSTWYEDDTAFENQSALFALAVSDIVLINICLLFCPCILYTAQIKLGMQRVVGYRQWYNKQWNAIRFSMGKLGDFYLPPVGVVPDVMPFSCKWVLSNNDAAPAGCATSFVN